MGSLPVLLGGEDGMREMPSKQSDASLVSNNKLLDSTDGSLCPATSQWLQFMTERIVENKDELFKVFSSNDQESTGKISRLKWAEGMMTVLISQCEGMLSPGLTGKLFGQLQLTEPVEYVRFLHRFQIRDDADERSVLVDRIKAVTQLKKSLVDFSAVSLDELLDPNGDRTVSFREFATFLPRFNVNVPPWQAASIYETM